MTDKEQERLILCARRQKDLEEIQARIVKEERENWVIKYLTAHTASGDISPCDALGRLLSKGDFDPSNHYAVVQHLKTAEIRELGRKLIAIGEVLDQPACDCCPDPEAVPEER